MEVGSWKSETFNSQLLTSNFHLLTSNFHLQTSHSKTLNNQELLIKLAHTKMPFGKYEGRYLIDLPEYYVVWFKNKGFPKGQLGEQLELVYELKLNGLEELIRNIKIKYPKK